jgi:molybdopterin converting factor small subunit
MRVTVRLFARLREIAGSGELTRNIAEPATIERVWLDLVTTYPALEAYTGAVSAARNLEYTRFGDAVGEGDEIAFLPPVSGG